MEAGAEDGRERGKGGSKREIDVGGGEDEE